MGFQIKDFVSIAASMINHAKVTQNKVTDFNTGSVARTLLEAPAIEIEELYQQMFAGLRDGIPVATYLAFDFDKEPVKPAVGKLRFTATDPTHTEIFIPSGTRAQTRDNTLTFRTLSDLTIPVGSMSAETSAICESGGADGNVPPNTVVVLYDSVSGVGSVTNPAQFFDGRNRESDEDQQARFSNFIDSLPRGTALAIEYGGSRASLRDNSGLTIESVEHIFVDEPYLDDSTVPTGLINVYIHNGQSHTSHELVAETQRVIDGYRDDDGQPVPGWKSAGTIVTVIAAQDAESKVKAVLTVREHADFDAIKSQCEAAITAYSQELGIRQPAYAAEIIAAVMEVPGVLNCHLLEPTTDVVAGKNEKIILTPVEITQ